MFPNMLMNLTSEFSLNKVFTRFAHTQSASFKNKSRLFPTDTKNGSLTLFSVSTNIVKNLALENLIAESINKRDNLNVLLFWISEPCIVFGRHQNPWLECDVREARARGVNLVRRYSGGGCVYHDLGNLNISFLTNRLKFDRTKNLNLIKSGVEGK